MSKASQILFMVLTIAGNVIAPFLNEGGRCHAQYTKLIDFVGLNGDHPNGSLTIIGSTLYGMTTSGGANDMGVIFKVESNGTGYSTMLDFDGALKGAYPFSSLVSDGAFLYGLTSEGGTNGMGTIFKIGFDGTGYSKLLDFSGITNGSYPRGTLFINGAYLYGMTHSGGTSDLGTVFRIMPNGTGYSKLLDFSGSANGAYPWEGFTSDGTFLYAVTRRGGTNDFGTLFKIKPDGTGFQKLLDFDGATNGRLPICTPYFDGEFLYASTVQGGSSDIGTLLKIKPNGTGFSKLLDFNGDVNGANPRSLVPYGPFLYGITVTGGIGLGNVGTIFRTSADGTEYSKLLDFDVAESGRYPNSSPIRDGAILYGMTNEGGSADRGVIYKYQLVEIVTSVEKNTPFILYPNPSANKLTVSLLGFEKAPVNITIIDSQGRVLETWSGLGQREVQFDVRNYVVGKYVISAWQNTTRISQSFIKVD